MVPESLLQLLLNPSMFAYRTETGMLAGLGDNPECEALPLQAL